MKQLLFLLTFMLSGNCLAQLGDASLQTDTSRLATPCDCHAAVILLMKEEIFLVEEFKRLGKEEPHVSRTLEELKKRDAKHYEVFTRCRSIYKEKGSGSDCENNTEGEELNGKITRLRAEVRMEPIQITGNRGPAL